MIVLHVTAIYPFSAIKYSALIASRNIINLFHFCNCLASAAPINVRRRRLRDRRLLRLTITQSERPPSLPQPYDGQSSY